MDWRAYCYQFSPNWTVDQINISIKFPAGLFGETEKLVLKCIQKCKIEKPKQLWKRKAKLHVFHYLTSRLITKHRNQCGIGARTLDQRDRVKSRNRPHTQSTDCWFIYQGQSMEKSKRILLNDTRTTGYVWAKLTFYSYPIPDTKTLIWNKLSIHKS